MFAQILYTQWRWTRALVASVAVVTFLAPVLAWRLAGGNAEGFTNPQAVMVGFAFVGPILAFVAITGAFLLAAYPWTVDAQAKHVYPLALPITWPRYVAMRFGAGALTLLIPSVTLWLGGLLVLALIELPPTLRAYPGTLALRFLAGALLAYTLTFALQNLARRKSPIVVLGILLVAVFLVLGMIVMGYGEVISAVADWLTTWPGPLAVFSAEWKLIDV